MDKSQPPHARRQPLKLLCGHLLYNLWLVYLAFALQGFYGIRRLDLRYWTVMLALVLFVTISRRLAEAYLKRTR